MRTAFNDEEAKIARELYCQIDLAVDQLPFTPQFLWMLSEYNKRTEGKVTDNEFFRRITNLRKRGGLRRSKPR